MAGIKTGFNDAFWLDAATRKNLLRKDRTIERFIKPLLVGDDIRKFRTKPLSKWIIYTPIGTDIKKLGPVEEHLAQWKDRLKKRALDQAWYELQQAQQRYCEQFEHPKIVYPDIAMESRFTFDTDGLYLDMTAFAIASSDKSLLGILNSQVVWFFLKRTAAVLGDADKRGRLRLKRQYVERIPLPEVPLPQQQQLARLVDTLLLLNRHLINQPEGQTIRDPLILAYLERVLNGLVYELYFPAEVQEAGVKIFDLVKKVDFPDLESIPEGKQLSRIRNFVETLYEGTHPLRVALDKLQTLDPIRIIEGKA
jgi:hypothetical protein